MFLSMVSSEMIGPVKAYIEIKFLVFGVLMGGFNQQVVTVH